MRNKTASRSVFGVWSMAAALLADPRNPLPATRQGAIVVRLLECLDDLRTSETPSLESWRDLADGMNWLQSCRESGWISDEHGVIDDAKEALLEVHTSFARHGKLRASGRGLEWLRDLVDNIKDLLAQITAQQYWSALKVTEKRVRQIHSGKVRPGDTVVQL